MSCDLLLLRHAPDDLTASRCVVASHSDRKDPCRFDTLAEIEAQGWSRYTGTAAIEDDGMDFAEKGAPCAGFAELSDEAETLRAKVDAAITGILG
jgi:hypothetical protein